MAKKPLRPCKKRNCSALTRDGFCLEHKPKHVRSKSADYHAWYSLPIWTKDLRPQQLLREPFCAHCEGRVYANTVDHIRPHRGDWLLFTSRDNLQSLCKHHHDKKTAKEKLEATSVHKRV